MLKRSALIILLLLTISLLLSGCVFNTQKQSEEVYIERIIDGDTVKTAAGKSIRLLGVDTPELDWENNDHEFYAREAREFSINNLLDKNVKLKFDQEKEDNYGRTLAYLYKNGENFNLKLLENGFATVMIVEPNDRYEDKFKKAAEKARRAKKGLWSQVAKLEKELPVISYQEAENYLSQKVIVEGKIVNTAATDSVNYLNFSHNYNSTLSIVIFNQNLNKFAYEPADYIKDKKIKVLGTVELYQGSPQIIVDDPHDILILD